MEREHLFYNYFKEKESSKSRPKVASTLKSIGIYENSINRLSNPLRYKTELCRSFQEKGDCQFGSNCTFAHGVLELRAIPRHPRYKSEFCKTYHSMGFCQYGIRCHFIHGADENNNQPPTAPIGMFRNNIAQFNSNPSDTNFDTVNTMKSNLEKLLAFRSMNNDYIDGHDVSTSYNPFAESNLQSNRVGKTLVTGVENQVHFQRPCEIFGRNYLHGDVTRQMCSVGVSPPSVASICSNSNLSPSLTMTSLSPRSVGMFSPLSNITNSDYSPRMLSNPASNYKVSYGSSQFY